ncbi:MAG: hypothetical protein IJ408_06820 [Clostridia bacterium]|nr:hypothetical protein [Clostridia bacterium]
MRKLCRYIAMVLITVMLAGICSACDRQDSEMTAQPGVLNEQKTDKEEQPQKEEQNKEDIPSEDEKQEPTLPPENLDKEFGDVYEPESGGVVTDDPVYVPPEELVDTRGFIPDDDREKERSERRAIEASKYDFDNDPIIKEGKPENTGVLPSFDIYDTRFVYDVKLSDLDGRTIVFYTASESPNWSYRDEKGETVTEWQWFDSLKSELGLNIKKRISNAKTSIDSALKDMNAGKRLDVLYSSDVIYPAVLAASRSLTPHIDINDVGSAPGICKTTMDVLSWGSTYRVIAPVGFADVLWYNKTLVQELGLTDPHTLWEQEKWDHKAFSEFLRAVPESTKDGKKLTALVHSPEKLAYTFPGTTGNGAFYVYHDAKAPYIINDWRKESTIRSWRFITDVISKISYVPAKSEADYKAFYEGYAVMSGKMAGGDFAENVKLDWVPYPMEKQKSYTQLCEIRDKKYEGKGPKPTVTFDGTAQYSGIGMLLPRKTADEENIKISLKFMQLWATRATEAYFDELSANEHYGFDHKQKKQYYDFISQNVSFSIPFDEAFVKELNTKTKFFDCFYADSFYDVKTEADKSEEYIKEYLRKEMIYGL